MINIFSKEQKKIDYKINNSPTEMCRNCWDIVPPAQYNDNNCYCKKCDEKLEKERG